MKFSGPMHLKNRRPALLPGILLTLAVMPGLALAQIQLQIELQLAPVITLSAPTGLVSQVQWSDNLAAPGRWFHLAHAATNQASITDTNPPGGRRFYRAVQVPNANMVLIPGSAFLMGDNFTNGPASERPVHPAFVGSFYLDRCEAGLSQWNEVYQWALTNGYDFDHAGLGKATNHPVHTVSWHDAVKWCNARSERAGRLPAYYTSPSQTTVYRGGQLNLTNDCVNWAANGYRLPTEAEWEHAARAGTNGLRFPNGNTLSHHDANFFAATYLDYDTTGVNDFHSAFATGELPYTSPCGWFAPNAYGLHDLTGNVWEWCWDNFEGTWYSQSAASQPDPRGPSGFTGNRILRGGSWLNDASFARNAQRTLTTYSAPTSATDILGFRTAITAPTISGQPVFPARLTELARLGNGALRFTISNVTPGKPAVIALSTNLAQWTPVWTNVPTAAAFAFTNAPTADTSPQFFRAWQVP